MLIKNLFARNTCFSPDDIAGGGGDAVVDTPAVDAPDTASVDGGNQDGKQTTEENKTPDYKTLYEKRGKENAHLVKTIKGFQDKFMTKTEQPSKSKDSGSLEDNLRANGLTADEDGFVNHKGMHVSAEFALKDIERDQKVSGMESALQAQRDAETQAEHNNALNEVFTGFQELCSDFAKVALPGLEGETQQIMSRTLESLARVSFANLRAEHGDTGITIDMMQDKAAEIVEEQRQLAMSIISKQFNNNKKYAENHPTKPDGQAGYAKPVDERLLKPAERAKIQEERSRKAEALSR